MTVKPIPDGYRSLIPYLSIENAAAAVEFYKQAFGAIERFRLTMPTGEIGHAEIAIGDSTLMLADPCETGVFRTPQSLGGTSVGIHLYVTDVDEQFARAVAAGATVVEPVKNQFYGDRNGTLQDPFGHLWFISTRVEELTPDEIKKRAETLFADSD